MGSGRLEDCVRGFGERDVYKDVEVLSRVREAGYRGFLVASSKVLADGRKLLWRRGVDVIFAEKIAILGHRLHADVTLRDLLMVLARVLL